MAANKAFAPSDVPPNLWPQANQKERESVTLDNPVDISVIIPTYNRLWALPAAVASCRGTRCRTEILVVDDGSRDGTWEWLQTLSDIVAVRQDNWGKDWAVNRAFAMASGEFVRFLDSDDWLAQGANDLQVDLARSTGADVVVAGYSLFDEDTRLSTPRFWEHCDDFVAQQLGECSSSHYSAYVIRKSFLADTPHRQEFGARDDRMFVIELAIKKPKVVEWNGLAFVHRRHNRERLQTRDNSQIINLNKQLLRVYRQAVSLLEGRGEFTVRRKRAVVRALWPLAHWIALSDLDEACGVAHWIYTLDPDFQPPEEGALGWLYRRVGFRLAEQILWARRYVVRMIGAGKVSSNLDLGVIKDANE